jgi:hypothetical protein
MPATISIAIPAAVPKKRDGTKPLPTDAVHHRIRVQEKEGGDPNCPCEKANDKRSTATRQFVTTVGVRKLTRR